MIRYLFPALLCCIGGCCRLSGQSADVLRYNAQLDRFYAENNRDSFLFYLNLKAQASRQADSLALWSWLILQGADYLSETGDDAAATAYLEQQLPQCWRKPQTMAEWEAYSFVQATRGWNLAQAGRLVAAVQALEAAAAAYEQYHFADLDPVESLYKQLGNCYTRLGDNDKAIAVFQKALKMGGDPETLAGLYGNLGKAYWNQQDFHAAAKYYKKGLDFPKLSPLKRGLLLGAMAQTSLDQGLLPDARRDVTASLRLLEPLGEPGQAYRYHSRLTAGIIYTRTGKLPEAARMLDRAREDALAVFGRHSRELAKCDIARAEVWNAQGDFLPAITTANQALMAVCPNFSPQNPLKNPDPASFYEEIAIVEALTVKAEAAVSSYQINGDISWLSLALECHDLAWQAELKLRRIYQYTTSKLFLQSDARSREAHAMRAARLLYEKTLDPAVLARGFQMAERSKAALLNEAVHENLISQRLVSADPRLAQLGSLRQNLSYFEKQILLNSGSEALNDWRRDADLLVAQINQLESALKTDYPLPDYFSNIGTPETLDVLQEGEALLEYFVGPAYVELFVVRKNQPAIWHSCPLDQTLNTCFNQFQQYFSDQNAILNDPKGYLDAAWKLGELVLPPEARSVQKLLVVPDGFLNFLPFDALLLSAPDGATNLRNAAYLVRSHGVRFAWSLRVLRQQRALNKRAPAMALTLAPGFSDGRRGLAALPFNASEGPANAQLLGGAQATAADFLALAGNFRILHLSTHAFAETAGGQPPRLECFDQALYLPEIYALALKADLVTLSACQTGLGQSHAGEGVMSLARAFAQAGAACVVSSLWSVNDQSTGQLLDVFYRKLEAGESTAAAIRSAKLSYLGSPQIRGAMQSPYFWAGLSVVGDDRALVESDGNRWIWVLGLVVVLAGLLWYKRQRK